MENDQEAVEDSGRKKCSAGIGEKLKELLTAKPASYSKDKEPRRAEKDQMSAAQEEFIQEKPQPSKSKEKWSKRLLLALMISD